MNTAIGADYVTTLPVVTLNGKSKGTFSPITKTNLGRGWEELLRGLDSDRNFSVFPVERGTKKVPLCKWEPFQNRKPTNEEVRLWGRRHQHINPAIVLGRVSGVIDLEADGDEGYRFLKEKGLPLTWTYKSPSGTNKLHHLYRYPVGFDYIEKAIKKIHSEVDLLPDGQYALLPSSEHPDGGLYEWVHSPDDTDLADCPEWLIEWIRDRDEQKKIADEALAKMRAESAVECTDEEMKRWAQGALRRQSDKLASTITGGRNITLFSACKTLAPYIRTGALTEAEVRSAIEQSCQQNRLILDDGHTQFKETFKSGIDAGYNLPVTPKPSNKVYKTPVPVSRSLREGKEGMKGSEGNTPELPSSSSPTITQNTHIVTIPAGNSNSVVWLCDEPEPEPRRFIVEGLIPEGFVTTFYGDGGLGKSFTALYLGMCVAMGKPFGSRQTIKQRVLYLDGELDVEEAKRRAYKIARGMGLDKPPAGLGYYSLGGRSLGDVKAQTEVRKLVHTSEIQFIIFDSLTMGTYSSDAKDAGDMVSAMKFLEGLCTTLAIDHIKGVYADENQSNLSEFGSAFKKYVARSRIQLVKGAAGGVALLHKKSNFGELQPPIYLALRWEGNRTIIEFLGANDSRMAGIEANMPALEQTWLVLANNRQGMSAEGVAEITGVAPKTASNRLSQLKSQGRVIDDPVRHVWKALGVPEVEEDTDDNPTEIPF